VSTGIHEGYVSGNWFVKVICTGVPVWATTAIPSDPAWPARPEPSS
jgi:hypothetical protein